MREDWGQLNHTPAWTVVEVEVTTLKSPRQLVTKPSQEPKSASTLADVRVQCQRKVDPSL